MLQLFGSVVTSDVINSFQAAGAQRFSVLGAAGERGEIKLGTSAILGNQGKVEYWPALGCWNY